MNLLIFLSVLAVVIALFWLLRLPRQFEVSRRTLIDAELAGVTAQVRDLRCWPGWSPWLIHEPDCALEFSELSDDVGSWYRWNGKLIGAGTLLTEKLSDNAITQQLEFQRPMRARNTIHWRFVDTGAGIEVSWSMVGTLPLLFRWLGPKMDEFVGGDFELGLSRLAFACGDQREPLRLEFSGTAEQAAIQGISQHYSGSIAEMPAAIGQAMDQLQAIRVENKLTASAEPLCVYHCFEPRKDFVDMDILIPISASDLPSDIPTLSLPARTVFRCKLFGSYQHLPQAWHAAFGHARMRKLRLAKGAPMLERYITSAADHRGLALETWIELPLR